MKSLFKVVDNLEEDNTYTKKVNIPQYLPSNKQPNLSELLNTIKYGELIKDINESSVTDEEKEFLKFAASRHIVFNYAKIADYYANANSEMQNLMEKSALVILDIDDAIANGYIKFSSRVLDMLGGTDSE